VARSKNESIGDDWWVHGPLIYGPKTLADRVAGEWTQVEGPLATLREAGNVAVQGPSIVELLGTPVLVLPLGTPTHFVALGQGGVLVRPHRKLGRRKPESFEVPLELGELEVGEGWQLFDAMLGATGELAAARAQARLDIPLAPGRHRVEHSKPAPLHELEYSAIRLLPVGAATPATLPVVRKAFPVDAEMRKLAKTLRFLDTEGGPFVALPERALAKWTGVSDEDDEDDDYERACSNRGFVLGEHEGLVLDSPDATAVLPTDEGVVFLRWLGADRAVDLLAALPFAKRWKKSKKTFVAKGPLVLFDAALAGRRLGKRKRLDVPLRRGEYAIDWTEVDGVVEGGHAVMAVFVRLRRV
jgi:hypothetical protein